MGHVPAVLLAAALSLPVSSSSFAGSGSPGSGPAGYLDAAETAGSDPILARRYHHSSAPYNYSVDHNPAWHPRVQTPEGGTGTACSAHRGPSGFCYPGKGRICLDGTTKQELGLSDGQENRLEQPLRNARDKFRRALLHLQVQPRRHERGLDHD